MNFLGLTKESVETCAHVKNGKQIRKRRVLYIVVKKDISNEQYKYILK